MKIAFTWLQSWFQTWPRRSPWMDVPALVALVVSIGFFFCLRHWSPATVRGHYSGVIRQALAKKEFHTARIACQRLLNLGSESNAETLFSLAQALEGLGQKEEASELLAAVAPYDRAVYAPAHLHVAKALLSGSAQETETTQRVLTQLNQVISLDPECLEANQYLGSYYFQIRAWELARKHLSATLAANPEAMFALATISRELGDTRAAKDWQERTLRYYKARVEKSRSGLPKDRLCYAQALLLEGSFPEALKVLEDELKSSGRSDFRVAISELYTAWAKKVAQTEPANLSQRIGLIQQGLNYAPQNPRLMELLLELSRGQGPESKLAEEEVNRMLAEGGSSAILHFVAGSEAWQRGNQEQARKHFTMAYDLAPGMPAVANNMAMLLAMGEQPELPRALEVINSALAKLPEEPHLRVTRGQILVKLGKFQAAIKDLEFALPLLQSKGAIHADLATAYQGIGMEKLAAEHTRLSKAPVKKQ